MLFYLIYCSKLKLAFALFNLNRAIFCFVMPDLSEVHPPKIFLDMFRLEGHCIRDLHLPALGGLCICCIRMGSCRKDKKGKMTGFTKSFERVHILIITS